MIVLRGCEFPEDLHYHVAHNVWLRESGGLVTLGATSFGVALAAQFVSFRPKAAGSEVGAGGSMGLIELWKTMVSVRTPVAGTIVEANEAAARDPQCINRDPYGAGWLVRLRTATRLAGVPGLVTGAAIAPAFEQAMALENFEGPAA